MDRIRSAVFAWCASLLLFKDTVKAGNTGKTGLQGDFRDGQIGLRQKFLSSFQPSENQIFIISKVGILFKKPCKMIL